MMDKKVRDQIRSYLVSCKSLHFDPRASAFAAFMLDLDERLTSIEQELEKCRQYDREQAERAG